MPSCNKRFEMRLPAREKNAAEGLAQDKGITVSELMRRALRAYAQRPEPLTDQGRMDVAALRRRINQIESRAGVGGGNGLAADIAQARQDAQALMSR